MTDWEGDTVNAPYRRRNNKEGEREHKLKINERKRKSGHRMKWKWIYVSENSVDTENEICIVIHWMREREKSVKTNSRGRLFINTIFIPVRYRFSHS